ncbi:hypothetical protein AAVH_38300, partial [Aphelenchoides avenae]
RETVNCRHKLTLEVTSIFVSQELGGLEGYESRNPSSHFNPSPSVEGGPRRQCTFDSIRGRRWTATYEETETNYYGHMHLKINHKPTDISPPCSYPFCSRYIPS